MYTNGIFQPSFSPMMGYPGMNYGSPMGGMSSAMVMFQMMSAMTMLMELFSMSQMASMSPNANFGQGSFGGGMNSSGLGNFLGGGSNGNSMGGSQGIMGGSGSGNNAAEIAKKYLGQKTGLINNMANFSHAGGMDNNCADFVSACLADAGVYKKKPGDASVATLKQHLVQDGWRKVSKGQTKPGDVAIFNGSQHVELVATNGATQHIGSNNGGTNVQKVSMDSGNWGSVEYYTKG